PRSPVAEQCYAAIRNGSGRTCTRWTRRPRWLRGYPARQPPAAAVGQCVKFQLDRVAEPDREIAMVLHRVLGQRVDQYVEPVAVQHQIRHDVFELVGLENDQNIGDRVRPDRRVAEAVDLDPELL